MTFRIGAPQKWLGIKYGHHVYFDGVHLFPSKFSPPVQPNTKYISFVKYDHNTVQFFDDFDLRELAAVMPGYPPIVVTIENHYVILHDCQDFDAIILLSSDSVVVSTFETNTSFFRKLVWRFNDFLQSRPTVWPIK